MHYGTRVPPTLAKNNFVKAQHSDIAVLQLVANLGHAEPNEVARLFSPYTEQWELKVGAKVLAYVVWLHCFTGETPPLNDAQGLASAENATLLVHSALEKLTFSEKAQLKKLAPLLLPVSRSKKVNPVTGMPLRYAELRLLEPANQLQAALTTLWPGWKSRGLPRELWQKLRTMAVKNQDSSAMALAQRRLKRLTAAKLLNQTVVGTNTKLYALTAAGAQYLGGTHTATHSRSSLKNLHKTLAKGVLLSELTRHTEGWSESSFYNKKHPGLLGSEGALTHKELFGSRPGSPLHPPDGVLMRPLVDDERTQTRWPVRADSFTDLLQSSRTSAIGLTLIEAERGNKSADEFVKSLLPLINGNSAYGHVALPRSFLAAKNGAWAALLEACDRSKNMNNSVPKEVLFVPSRLIYALESAEFLKPILTATWQFVQSRPTVTGATKGAGTPSYSRTGLKLDVLDDSAQAAELVLWQELLTMVDINFCAVSVSGATFLGVSARFNLADFAEFSVKEADE